jgi:hypothetical protein
MKTHLVLIALMIVGGCATQKNSSDDSSIASSSKSQNGEIRKVLAGAWGWDKQQCEKDPIRLSFAADGAVMFHENDAGLSIGEGTHLKRIVYQILAESDRVLRTVIEGEVRRTKEGNVVGWDLVLLSESRFCWHRSDWPSGCTRALIKCGNVQP